jgi:hypothetical protein
MKKRRHHDRQSEPPGGAAHRRRRGLKRVVKQEQADGSCILSEFDNAGRLLARPMRPGAGRSTG